MQKQERVNTRAISPQEFKNWYRKADLELIAGVDNQEIFVIFN